MNLELSEYVYPTEQPCDYCGGAADIEVNSNPNGEYLPFVCCRVCFFALCLQGAKAKMVVQEVDIETP
jgi:hypothetical protein